MKHLLPDRVELAAMAAMALGCALIVYYRPAVDLWMAAMAVPLFIVSSLMGLRRNWRAHDHAEDTLELSEAIHTDRAEQIPSPRAVER